MTESVFLKGKAKWVRVHKPNQWDKWTCTLYPDPDSLTKILELKKQGLKNTLRRDEDGEHMVFNRPTQKVIRGKLIPFAAPEAFGENSRLLHKELQIGNGSDVTIKLEVYEHGTPNGGKAKAARFESIKVHNLVPFEPKRDFEEDQQKMLEGLLEQPDPIF